MNTLNNKWQKIGVIGVDAGLCWLGDPCYFVNAREALNIGQESEFQKLGYDDWDKFLDSIDNKTYPRQQQYNYAAGHPGLGVLVDSGYGDGVYPVYVKYNKGGRVAEVKVVFIEKED